ncbi:MAG: hypothetical protein JXD18_11070 [Anaerolineae bacterium]|nr:hypothetical protein [Anaerolineae bacterium]
MQKWLCVALAMMIVLTLSPTLAAQEEADAAARLLERMSPDARVGQLFLVTFPGTETDEASMIYDLIVNEQIGGVLLSPEDGNIVNEGDTPLQVATLANALQHLAWASESPFVPLFVAVEQEGNGTPHTAIVSGTTQLPSPMSIGATWNPSNAETAGRIAGQELASLGINMLFGPSLDVLNTPRPTSAADLGVRSFGGDPYWVGQMGTAYIHGIHDGSQGRVAVIASHFPGLGAADRPLSEEVSTVQKSLEQLKQIELAPFFAVVNATDPLAQPDGLLVSHISYRGFQGNLYQSTKPVSFDPQALQTLMALPELSTWRENDGITVADELGVRAVRRFYDPTEQTFNSLRIAREAFVAGNDLLLLSHFALGDDWATHADNIRSTLAFFREKYATDPTFQARVDAAVLRILRLKLRLYGVTTPTMTINTALVDAEAANESVGRSREQVTPVAQQAVTLLSPLSSDLRPAPPAVDESIVIFTDDRLVTPCDTCAPIYAISPTALEETLVRLYGPQATYQVNPARIRSFTFTQLTGYLTSPPVAPEPVEGDATPQPPDPLTVALEEADWVIFAMLDITDQVPSSSAVRRFLAEQPNLLRNKSIIVFAFGAPYYLDTTEIAKLQAYFALYTHTQPFIEVAVRALFDEFPFTGYAPVSVPGINYDLIVQTQPDPAQTIQIAYEVIGAASLNKTDGTVTPGPTPQSIEIRQGDTLRLHTSVIVDHNHHRVPDGTPVDFYFTYPQEGLGLEYSVQVTTRDGVAETTTTLAQVGQLQISVRADPVPRAVRLEMDIREGGLVSIVTPPPTITATPEPTPSATPEPTPDSSPTPSQSTGPSTGNGSAGREVDWTDFVIALIAVAIVAFLGYVVAWRRRQGTTAAIRTGLWCVIGGLGAYIALALGVPGTQWAKAQPGKWAIAAIALIGTLVPWLVTAAVAVAKRTLTTKQTKAEE